MTLFSLFKSIGGHFATGESELEKKAQQIKAICFDWDGVFNDGTKASGQPNGFAEADSMGINLLRFSLYRHHGHTAFPIAAILSGERNENAAFFGGREKFNALYFKVSSKKEAFAHFCTAHGLEANQVAWFFDDILDLSIAEHAGLRFYISKSYQPLTTQYILKNKLADYIPSQQSGPGAIRECCELMWGLLQMDEEVIRERIAFSPEYAQYLEEKFKQELQIFTADASRNIISGNL